MQPNAVLPLAQQRRCWASVNAVLASVLSQLGSAPGPGRHRAAGGRWSDPGLWDCTPGVSLASPGPAVRAGVAGPRVGGRAGAGV